MSPLCLVPYLTAAKRLHLCSQCCSSLQAPLAYAGVSFGNRRPYQILQDMSGVLQPVRASYDSQSMSSSRSRSHHDSNYMF